MRNRRPGTEREFVDNNVTEIEQDIKPPVQRRLVQTLIAALIVTTVAALIVAKVMVDQKNQASVTASKAFAAQTTAEARLTALPTPIPTPEDAIVPLNTLPAPTATPDAYANGQMRSVQLAYVALQQIETDPEASVQVALAANQAGRTKEAEDALRRALAASHIRLRLHDDSSPIRTAEFSPNGEMILTINAAGITRLLDAHTGTLLSVLLPYPFKVLSAAFSPDNQYVVTTSNTEVMELWTTKDGALQSQLNDSEYTTDLMAVHFSPDGARIAAGSSDATVRVWETRAVTATIVLSSPVGSINQLEWSPDGRRLLAAANNGASIWDAQTGHLLFIVINEPGARIGFDVHFSPDSTQLVATGSAGLRILDATNGTVLHKFNETPWYARFSPDGGWLVAGKQMWNLKTMQVMDVLHSVKYEPVLFGHDVWTLCMANDIHTLSIWSLVGVTKQYSQTATFRTETILRDYQLSSDGKEVISVESNGVASVWSVAQDALPQDYTALLTLAGERAKAMRQLTCPERRALLGENLVCPTPMPLRT